MQLCPPVGAERSRRLLLLGLGQPLLRPFPSAAKLGDGCHVQGPSLCPATSLRQPRPASPLLTCHLSRVNSCSLLCTAWHLVALVRHCKQSYSVTRRFGFVQPPVDSKGRSFAASRIGRGDSSSACLRPHSWCGLPSPLRELFRSRPRPTGPWSQQPERCVRQMTTDVPPLLKAGHWPLPTWGSSRAPAVASVASN